MGFQFSRPIFAAARADPAALARLIEAGEDPMCADAWGWTPLHHAALGNQAESVRLLVKVPAVRVNALGSYALSCPSYLSPLQVAASNRSLVSTV